MTNETTSKSYKELIEDALELIDRRTVESLFQRHKKDFVDPEVFLRQLNEEVTEYREKHGSDPGLGLNYPEKTQPVEYFLSRVAFAIARLTVDTERWRRIAKISSNKTHKEALLKAISRMKALIDGPGAAVYDGLYFGQAIVSFDSWHLFDGTIDSKAAGILDSARPLNLTSIVDLLTQTSVDLSEQETDQPAADPEPRDMRDADLKRHAIQSVFTAWQAVTGEIPDLGERRSGVAYPLVKACIGKAAQQAGLIVKGEQPFATDIEAVHAQMNQRVPVKRKNSG